MKELNETQAKHVSGGKAATFYTIVTGYNASDLMIGVLSQEKLGYELYGDPFSAGFFGYMCQAMVKVADTA